MAATDLASMGANGGWMGSLSLGYAGAGSRTSAISAEFAFGALVRGTPHLLYSDGSSTLHAASGTHLKRHSICNNAASAKERSAQANVDGCCSSDTLPCGSDGALAHLSISLRP